MSNIILPPGVVMPAPIQTSEKPDAEMTDAEKAKQLPEPSGYKLLCVLPAIDETIEGTNFLKSKDMMKREEVTTAVLFVVKVGPDAYSDKEKFPSGPWCKQGDFIMVRTYAGTRFKMYGQEMRLINDDQVEGVVQDPRGITHV
jgi:co-chaperonin GroES (HSP10)